MKNKNLYLEIKERQKKEVDNLPLYFAFGDRQLKERADELGFASVDDMIKNIVGIGAGGFVKKEDFNSVIDTFKRHDEEMKEALKDNYILQQALEYELANHEYIITYDIDDTLRSLGITREQYENDDRLKNIMKLAISNYKKDMEALGW